MRIDDPERRTADWTVTSIESAHACGDRLVRILPPHLGDLLAFIDRQKFLDRIRMGPKLRGIYSKSLVEAVLLIDGGPSGRLDELLAEMEEYDPSSELVRWAKQRRTRRRVDGEIV
jgi:hypothetical protein